jgi:hypothetical protein
MKSWCVIIQGQSNHVPILKEKWNGVDLIWSTWIGEESKYENGDIVIFSEFPTDRGVHNLHMQMISTLNGINKAKELGYTHVIKWRSDQYPTNSMEFLKLLDKTKLTFLSGNDATNYPYLIDYFTSGPIEDVELLWTIPTEIYKFPEEAITKQLLSSNLQSKVDYIHQKLSETNDVFWLGRNFTLLDMLTKDYGYNPNLFKN